MATPSKLRAVYRAVEAAAKSHGADFRAHISRFDADGAVEFFTFEPASDALIADAEKASERAGGWLLGARAAKLDPYLKALRAAVDPNQIMNPGTLG
jgi:FAD/FMN-containing dehydrogenase